MNFIFKKEKLMKNCHKCDLIIIINYYLMLKCQRDFYSLIVIVIKILLIS